MKKAVIFLAAALSVATLPCVAFACDLCALYTSMQVDSPSPGAIRLSASEQYTEYDKVQFQGHYTDNPADQYLKSSVTLVSGQYDMSEQTALQFVAPIISRSYRRVQDDEPTSGDVSGFGDMSLLFHYNPVRYSDGKLTVRVRLFAGVEAPTGDAHLLGEETEPGHVHGGGDEHEEDGHGEDGHGDEEEAHHSASQPKHGDEDHVEQQPLLNAIHGHDLALGSGSWDFPLGFGLTTQWDRFIASADAQYNINTIGAFHYRYANQLMWTTSLGAFVYLEDETQVTTRARLSGQWKEFDVGRGGVEYPDTAQNYLFLGPEVNATVASQLQMVLGLDIPVDMKNSDLQVVPTSRFRASLTYKF